MSAIADVRGLGASILDLVIRHPNQEGLRLLTIQIYFDGSGKSHDPNCEYVALAGYLATEAVWADFEKAFVAFTERKHIDYFHSTDLAARKGCYQNLTLDETVLLFSEFTSLLRNFARSDFSAALYDVSMQSYRASPRKLPLPEAICGSGALDALCQNVPAEHELQIFYDRGESFFPHLQNMWCNPKRRRADPRLNRINVFAAVDDWRKYPALQAADLLAWFTARGPEYQLDLATLTAGLAVFGCHYGESELNSLTLPLPFYGGIKA